MQKKRRCTTPTHTPLQHLSYVYNCALLFYIYKHFYCYYYYFKSGFSCGIFFFCCGIQTNARRHHLIPRILKNGISRRSSPHNPPTYCPAFHKYIRIYRQKIFIIFDDHHNIYPLCICALMECGLFFGAQTAVDARVVQIPHRAKWDRWWWYANNSIWMVKHIYITQLLYYICICKWLNRRSEYTMSLAWVLLITHIVWIRNSVSDLDFDGFISKLLLTIIKR